MPDIAIKVENLSKVYKLYNNPVDRLKESINPFRKKYHRDFYALRDLNFEVRRGETVGIIGKNGSGKSTLLKIVTGVLTPSSGAVATNGKISSLLELGTGFNPELTGIENVYFNGTITGYTKEQMDGKLDDIFSFADIGDFIYQPVKVYSSGMYMRLAFAVATAIDPEILIIDEALSVGDAKFQLKCFKRMKAFEESGRTILLVSHDLNSVCSFCKRAIFLHDGRVHDDGESERVTKVYYKTIFCEPAAPVEQKTQQVAADEAREGAETKQVGADEHGPCAAFPEAQSSATSLGKYIRNKDALKNCSRSMSMGNKKASIFDFGILDEQGEITTLLRTGNDYTFYFRVKCEDRIDNITAGFLIRNQKGIDIYGTTSLLNNLLITPHQKGDIFEVRAKIRLSLANGVYFLTFALADSQATNDEQYDAQFDALQFEIVRTPEIFTTSIVDLQAKITYAMLGKVDA